MVIAIIALASVCAMASPPPNFPDSISFVVPNDASWQAYASTWGDTSYQPWGSHTLEWSDDVGGYTDGSFVFFSYPNDVTDWTFTDLYTSAASAVQSWDGESLTGLEAITSAMGSGDWQAAAVSSVTAVPESNAVAVAGVGLLSLSLRRPRRTIRHQQQQYPGLVRYANLLSGLVGRSMEPSPPSSASSTDSLASGRDDRRN